MSIFDSSAKIEQQVDEYVRNLPVVVTAQNANSPTNTLSISAERKIMRERFGIKSIRSIELKVPDQYTTHNLLCGMRTSTYSVYTDAVAEIILHDVESDIPGGVFLHDLISVGAHKSDVVFNCVIDEGEGKVKFVCTGCMVTQIVPKDFSEYDYSINLYDMYIDVSWYQVIV